MADFQKFSFFFFKKKYPTTSPSLRNLAAVATKHSALFLIFFPAPHRARYDEGFLNDALTINIDLSQYVSFLFSCSIATINIKRKDFGPLDDFEVFTGLYDST